MADATQADIQAFIDRWHGSGAAERANYQLFLAELCDVIGVAHPQPASQDPHENAYVFEKRVPSAHGTTNFIDLYKRSCFVLEAKQGSDKPAADPVVFSEAALQRSKQRKTGTAVRGTKAWDTAMERARQQAQSYARSLPSEEISQGRPPFLLVVDVGNTIALYSEFSRTGGNYIPFPDPSSYRLKLDDLHDANVRQMLGQVWDDPMSLDPSRRSARVTRTIAARLAELAKSLEGSRDAETVSHFLMRCLFTMFAEDVGLLPERSFTQLLDDIRQDPPSFQPMLQHLWKTMDEGGFSVILRRQIPRFNGGLFADQTALPLNLPQIELLVEAAKADWRDVEPAIFGTLLERALDPVERHKLGAHYTPRAYVERLVTPTIIEPLRAEWASVQAAALLQAESGQLEKAIAEIASFQRRLASLRILDPACGSGNFLYVTLEHLKRLEGEVLNTLHELGAGQMMLEMESVTVSPQQFLGIEVNPRAAAIAELVLWIGYLQWHYRTRGNAPHAEPIIRDFHNIECRDAVLAWDRVEPLLDETDQPVTRWDGRTTKPHPITGEEVPDEAARIPAYKYINPRPAQWPQADFIVGNPPFIANRNLRSDLGDGYVDALQKAFVEIREAVDFVMFFWHMASQKLVSHEIQRFGLITTNSIRMIQNQGVVNRALSNGGKIVFAVPDHPWPGETADAKVRISMTVLGQSDKEKGLAILMLAPGHDEVATARLEDINSEKFLLLTKKEIPGDLSPSVDVSSLVELTAWTNLCHAGMKPYGVGFLISSQDVMEMFSSDSDRRKRAPEYRNGSDVARKPRGVHVLDFYGLDEATIKQKYPLAYQHLILTVKAQRTTDRNLRLRQEWWSFEANRPPLRDAIADLRRYIVTVENSPKRYFTFLESEILPDQKLRIITSEDAYILGVMSSIIHIKFSFRTGGRQGVANTPVYNTRCCVTFPFPDATEPQKAHIRELAEQLDAHRKRQQAQHPTLTLTDMYNVLEKVRAQEPLSAKEKTIHAQGLISILAQLHDAIDEAVFAAYGWPATLSDEEILQHLVDLNAARAAEEAAGHVRWLRPAYQAPDQIQAQQTNFIEADESDESQPVPATKQAWPKALKERATAVRAVLAGLAGPTGVEGVAAGFNGNRTQKRLEEVGEILEMLVALGQIGEADGKYTVR